MSQDEGPVELLFRKLTRIKVDCRSGPDIDAVDLDTSNLMARPPALAASHQYRQPGRAAINAFCGCVEVISDTVDPTESGHDGQTTNECELGRWHLLGECVQGTDQTRRRPARPIEKEDLTRHERGLPDSIPRGSPVPDRDPGPGPVRPRCDWPPGSPGPGAVPVPTTRTGTGTPPPVQPTVYQGTHRGSGARFVARSGSPRRARPASPPWPQPEPDAIRPPGFPRAGRGRSRTREGCPAAAMPESRHRPSR